MPSQRYQGSGSSGIQKEDSLFLCIDDYPRTVRRNRDARVGIRTTERAEHFTGAVIPNQLRTHRTQSGDVKQLAIIRGGEWGETERGVKCCVLGNGDRRTAQYSTTRIEWLRDQISITPGDEVAIGENHIRAQMLK